MTHGEARVVAPQVAVGVSEAATSDIGIKLIVGFKDICLLLVGILNTFLQGT